MTWRRTLLLTCVVAVLVALPACAEKQWDTGDAIEGNLQDKAIKLPVSLVGPSTDTMSCQNPDDTDHSIDPEQSEGEEGTDSDVIADWGATKCWWWTEGGEVTQNSWTTTWTAPAESGWYRLECGVEDLPKSIPQSESGCRDDARHYAGTGYAGAAGQSSASQAGTGAPPPAAAVGATLQLLTSGQASNEHSFGFQSGGGTTRCCTDPNTTFDYRASGFYKRVEIVAQIDPPLAGEQFYWRQDTMYTYLAWKNGMPFIVETTNDWENDDPSADHCLSVSDAQGRIFMWDAPGIWAALWVKREMNWDWTRVDFAGTYRNAVLYKGKAITGDGQTTNFGLQWPRRVIVSGPDGGHIWTDVHVNE